MTFHLRPIYGLPVRCRFTEQHRDDVIAALDGYKNVKVLVRGTGIYDRQNNLSRVEPVEHVAQLDTLDVDAQLDDFRNLQDGWLNGEGTAPNHAELDWLSEVFGRHYPDNLPLPHAYPTADGGVSLEWSLGAREVDILVNISARKGKWYAYNTTTGRGEDERCLNLDKSDDWQWVATRLRHLAEQK